MPETHFLIRWPDGTRETCYSPSRVVRDYLAEGQSYALRDFLDLSHAALSAASERVREKYGVPCGRALNQIARLQAASRAFAGDAAASVTIESLQNRDAFQG
ncbi:MAG: MSMEG_0570 family nitrogen starvation response protein [Beijerinckiaceae bacterium]